MKEVLKRVKIEVLPVQFPLKDGFRQYVLYSKEVDTYSYAYQTVLSTHGWEKKHLYFVANDPINDGDYYICYDVNFKNPVLKKADLQKSNEWMVSPFKNYCKKVVATTNIYLGATLVWDNLSSLIDNPDRINNPDSFKPLFPQLSEEFIRKFINQYNNGNCINDVMVEYEVVEEELKIKPLHSKEFWDGFDHACNLLEDMYASTHPHKYNIADCLKAKVNRLPKEKVRLNKKIK